MRTLLHQDIPRRKQTCSVGLEAFAPGMEYFSILHEDEQGRWTRSDFCPNCWSKKDLQQEDLSFWKSIVPSEKKLPKTNPELNEKILELLKQALEGANENELKEAFILALYLSRKKKLALRTQQENSMVYEILATEELLKVPKYDLSPLEIDQIQTSLSKKIDG